MCDTVAQVLFDLPDISCCSQAVELGLGVSEWKRKGEAGFPYPHRLMHGAEHFFTCYHDTCCGRKQQVWILDLVTTF